MRPICWILWILWIRLFVKTLRFSARHRRRRSLRHSLLTRDISHGFWVRVASDSSLDAALGKESGKLSPLTSSGYVVDKAPPMRVSLLEQTPLCGEHDQTSYDFLRSGHFRNPLLKPLKQERGAVFLAELDLLQLLP